MVDHYLLLTRQGICSEVDHLKGHCQGEDRDDGDGEEVHLNCM